MSLKVRWRDFAKFDQPTREKTYTIRVGDELIITNPGDKHPSLRLLFSEDGLIVETFSSEWVPAADDLLKKIGL